MVSSEILQVAVWQVSRGAWPGYVATQMPVDCYPEGGGTVSTRRTSACAPSAAADHAGEVRVGSGSLTEKCFLTELKTLVRKGACSLHTNEMGKGACQHCYVHWKELCHKLLWAELKHKRWKSSKPITTCSCWALSSDSPSPYSKSVKCGFTSSLGVIPWQHSQLLQACERKYHVLQIKFLEVMAQQSQWSNQIPRWAKAKAAGLSNWLIKDTSNLYCKFIMAIQSD